MSHDPSTDDHEHTTSRRRVLGAIGAGAVAGTGLTAGGTPSPDDRPGRYMVGLQAGASFDVARARADTTYHELDFGDIGKLFTGRFPEPALDALRNNPQVRYVERDVLGRPDVDRTASTDGAGSLASSQTVPYGISQINADDAANAGYTGAGIDIAILDTGIDPDHEDLAWNLGTGTSIVDCSTSCGCHDCDGVRVCPTYSDCETYYDDRDGHGTHVAGTAAAVDNATGVVGVAPDATVHVYKIADCTGCAFTSDAAAAFEHAADDGRDVANLSYSFDHTQGLRDAVDYAGDNGVMMVTSAGNADCSDCIRAPGTYPEVITVTAVDSNEDPYSNNSTGPEVDFAAPGVFVDSTVPNDEYALFTGTSMASPHVAGTAAIALSRTDSALEARDLMELKADDLGLAADEEGFGQPNVEAMVVEPWVERGGLSTTETEATLGGYVHHFGEGASSGEAYFEWGPHGEGLPNTTSRTSLSSTGHFSDTISGLTCDTSYDYRAVVESGDGDVGRSFTLQFWTDDCFDDCDSSFCSIGPVEYRFGSGG